MRSRKSPRSITSSSNKIAESDPSYDCRRSAPDCSHSTRQRGRVGDANHFGCFFPEINESPPRHFLYRIAADINEMFVALVKMLSPVVGIELAGSLIVEYRTALLEFHIGKRGVALRARSGAGRDDLQWPHSMTTGRDWEAR